MVTFLHVVDTINKSHNNRVYAILQVQAAIVERAEAVTGEPVCRAGLEEGPGGGDRGR